MKIPIGVADVNYPIQDRWRRIDFTIGAELPVLRTILGIKGMKALVAIRHVDHAVDDREGGVNLVLEAGTDLDLPKFRAIVDVHGIDIPADTSDVDHAVHHRWR
jgi:hypothetical protein